LKLSSVLIVTFVNVVIFSVRDGEEEAQRKLEREKRRSERQKRQSERQIKRDEYDRKYGATKEK
jgi:hypothetical protein